MPLNLEEHAREIFFKCLRKDSPKERQAFIEAESTGDPALKLAVEHLVQLHENNRSFLEEPFDELLSIDLDDRVELMQATDSRADAVGSTFGGYKLLQQIGEGGFGVVYMAQQTEPVRRKVALKVIKRGMDSKEVIARFEAERQALAMMDHPNVAKVLDGGTTESGRFRP